jgi:hypothetical protein
MGSANIKTLNMNHFEYMRGASDPINRDSGAPLLYELWIDLVGRIVG